ncbi:hypothetical protein [Polynucleobacter sp. AP-Nino-20-G2]|uniref:hypothetical protein n=1 Tax=Polynucleobacter sp. AP-Nino-20-G2 TaxID=2576917 RepID=UPI001BFEE6D5|nr:hypothetical protein [Polynucleobacter sp. AP-Nino-20-G2]QWE16435.1 hypothetical protein FD960_09175 [Polynucleobacter sp. AP-Nino-20-G2]
MSDLKEELIRRARKSEPAFEPFSEMQVIENLLRMAGTAHAMEVAAYKASEIFGYDWAEKEPKTEQGKIFKEELSKIVSRTGKQEGDTRYVRWQRFQAFGKVRFLDQQLSPPTNKKPLKVAIKRPPHILGVTGGLMGN